MEVLRIGRHLHTAAVVVHALDLVEDQFPVALAVVVVTLMVVRCQEVPEHVEVRGLVGRVGITDEHQPGLAGLATPDVAVDAPGLHDGCGYGFVEHVCRRFTVPV